MYLLGQFTGAFIGAGLAWLLLGIADAPYIPKEDFWWIVADIL